MSTDPSLDTVYPRHQYSIPYSDPSSRLRTLDIHQYTSNPPPNAPWLIYIHGGAWRDPKQDSRCVEPTLAHLQSTYPSTLSSLAGIASLNYRLSPYTTQSLRDSNDGDAPSSSIDERNKQDEEGPVIDDDNTVSHPTHIRDVALAISFLTQNYSMKRYIGAGHSCGATLLLQLVSGIGLPQDAILLRPESLILIAGIYHVPLFLRNHSPPSTPVDIADIYRAIITGAFGPPSSPDTYLSISPISGNYGKKEWPEGRLVVLCHSYADELVERAQRDVFCVKMERDGWGLVVEEGDEEDDLSLKAAGEGRRVLNVRDVKGGHDEVWEEGGQVAKLVGEVVGRLG